MNAELQIAEADSKIIAAAIKEHYKQGHKDSKSEKAVANVQFYAFRKAELFAAWRGDVLAGYAALRFPKTVKEGWGRYVILEAVWTAPTERGKGVAALLVQVLKDHAASRGCDRWGSIAGTPNGIRLQARLGHHFWGFNEEGGGIVDTPLVSGGLIAPGPYALSRIVGEPRLLGAGELEAAAQALATEPVKAVRIVDRGDKVWTS